MSGKQTSSRIPGWLRSLVLTVVFTLIVLLLMLWLLGTFSPKIDHQPAASRAPERSAQGVRLETVQALRLPVVETAVGSIRPVYETQVASQILARVVRMDLKAGQSVKAGQILAELDSTEIQARLQQAKAALKSAQAARDQAQTEQERVEKLLAQKAATQIEAERYRTALRTAQSLVDQAAQAVEQTQTFLNYATIRAPRDGVIVEKRLDVGDMAAPGQVIAVLYDPTRMQLVASVRESLAYRLKVGQSLDVHLEALDQMCTGQISEIVPQADVASRSFLVKVAGPCHPGVYAGMFGRLRIPLAEQEILAIPSSALIQVGQLTMVDVAQAGKLQRRAVQVGRTLEAGSRVEILSGLKAGEQVAVAPAPAISGTTSGHHPGGRP